MRRQAAISWAVGALCWAALASASACAVVLLTAPGQTRFDVGVDLIKLPASTKPNWQPRPVADSALSLFLSPSKGPRADLDPTGADDAGQVKPADIRLASVSTGSTASVGNGLPARLAGIQSLANPIQRAEEKACLADVIYFEARGQPVEAQIAVGQTVINRVLSGVYPRTLCGVAHQRNALTGQCQYSFACDGLGGIGKERADWELAQELAERLLRGEVWLPEIGDATHSHPLAEHPAWVKYLQRVKRIGAMVFYRGDFAGASAIPRPDID